MRRIALISTALLIVSGLCLVSAPAGEAEKGRGPNLLVDVSGRLIGKGMGREVDRTELYADEIDDTPVAGTQRTVGRVHAELVPDPCRGVLDVVLGACNYSSEVASPFPVRIYTNTVAPFEVRQRIFLTPESLRSAPGLGGATACVTLVNATDRHGDPESFVALLARNGFRQRKEDVESIVVRKAVRKATQRLEEELAPNLAGASRSIGDALRRLKRLGLIVEGLQFETTSTRVQGRLQVATPGNPRLAPAPELPPEGDLAIRVHESLLNHAAAALGGNTYRLSDLTAQVDGLAFLLREEAGDGEGSAAIEEFLKGLTGAAPEFTLAKEDPITVAFAEAGFTVEGHIASITLDGKSFVGARVRAAYRVENREGKALAVREGPVRLLPAGEETEDGKRAFLGAARRLVLETMLARVLKSRFALSDLTPSEMSGLGTLRAARVEAEGGWLMLSWKLPVP